jgi:Domain of unknown function (DUF4926)
MKPRAQLSLTPFQGMDRAKWRMRRHGKKYLDHTIDRVFAQDRALLGVMMDTIAPTKDSQPALLDVVTHVMDRPDVEVFAGIIGTVVENLDDRTSLAEFFDDMGHAQAIAACLNSGVGMVSKA